MDIMKGSLDSIARPAVVSRSRPGSRISSAHSVEKLKLNSTLGSFEVLTPDVGVAELLPDQRWLQKSPGELSTAEEHEPEDTNQEDTEILISSGRSSKEDNLELHPERNDVKENSQTPCLSGEETDFGGLQDPTENITDHKLEKAIRKMQALDEILLKKLAKEMAVKARGIQMRKQLWEELQLVTMQTSGRSHEESVNTNRFLALTPQLDEAEDAATYEIEKLCSPVFATQLPVEENERDVKESRQGNPADSVLLNNREQSSQTAKNVKSKTQAKGVDFIQRNIMLAKDAGSIMLLLDDEKLRLEQLLEDIQDDTSDEELLEDVSRCIVPGEGYTPEPVEYDRLAKIEAELQVVLSSKDLLETSYPGASSPKLAFQEASTNKTGNLETAPGEKVLRHTKEIRKEKLRMREIEKQLNEIQQSLSSASLTSEHCGSQSPESSICFEYY